jgi:hypothetical protein
MQASTEGHEGSVVPQLTVVVVTDYAAGEAKSWSDFEATLQALAAQDTSEPFRVLICESNRYEESFPAELLEICPHSEVVFSPVESSYGLKNVGAGQIETELVGLLDADCIPAKSWVRGALEAFRQQPDIVAVSGRTMYEGRNSGEKMMGLRARGYLDPGKTGQTRYIANNNSVFRTEVYRKWPLPADHGAFASRMQSEALLREGCRFWFSEEMSAIHDFEGWSMEADIRRNHGYGSIVTRLEDPKMPQAWLMALGPLSIPVFVIGKTFQSWGDCLRCGVYYGLKWYEVPLAMLLSVGLHVMEIPGMWKAFHRQQLAETAYR